MRASSVRCVASNGICSIPINHSDGEPRILSGKELLSSGELVLQQSENVCDVMCFVTVLQDDLDGTETAPVHSGRYRKPGAQPVTLHAWETVYCNHKNTVIIRSLRRASGCRTISAIAPGDSLNARRD